jgi:hypothetical protein
LGDHILRVGDVETHDDSWYDALSARYGTSADSTVPLIIRRGDATDTLTMHLTRTPRPRVRVTVDPNASAKASAIRHSLFTGTPSPHV